MPPPHDEKTRLLTSRQCDNVRLFAYHGSDSSLVYKFFLSPLAQGCVDWFTPAWMAPNVITTLGLAFTMLAAGLTLAYNPEFDRDDPDVGWLAAVSSCCMFLYQTFDNMDGKQARKTGSSSPLGLLFDHGCDAINVCLSIIPVASALGLGWNDRSAMLLAVIPLIPFYSQTWELYYMKTMVLPIINGPSEGLLMAIAMMMTTYHTGSAVWFHRPLPFPFLLLPTSTSGMEELLIPCKFLTLVAVTGAAGTCILNFSNVQRRVAEKDGPFSQANPVLGFLPFAVFYGSLLLWLSHSQVALEPAFRWWTLLLGSSVFIEMVSHINLMHIVDGTLRPRERYWVCCIAYFAVTSLPAVRPLLPEALGERYLLVPCALAACFVTVRMLHRMNQEVAEALGIYVFVLGKKPPLNIEKRH